MKKHKKKFKDFFNFKFSDSNDEIVVRNYKIFDASLRAFFLYLLLILPIFAFSYVIFANPNLDFYIKYKTSDGSKIWDLMELSNGNLILGFWIVGFLFLIATMFAFLLFKPILTGKRFPKSKRYLYIIFLAVLALFSILFFGLSQFEYSRFFEYYRYSLLFENYQDIKFDWAIPLTKYFMDHHETGTYNFGWASSSMTLWIMFAQMMIAFVSFLVLQNAVFAQYNANDLKEENYILLNNSHSIGDEVVVNNRFLRALKNFFRNDQRNLAVYIIVGSFIVLLSNFIYSIIITSSSTNVAAMINWSYRTSYLFSDLKGFINDQGLDGYQQAFGLSGDGQYYGSLFTISSLQIIFLGLTISVLFFFIVVFVREKRVSYKVFTVQTGVLFVLLIITMSSMLASKVLVYQLQNVWNTNDNNIKFLGIIKQAIGSNDANMNALFANFKPNDIFSDQGFKVEWLSQSSNIADAIIMFTFISALFIVVTIKNNHLQVMTKKLAKKLKAAIKKDGRKDATTRSKR